MDLKIGIAGLRRGMGFAKLLAARKDCRVTAVCDHNPARAAEVAALVGARPFKDYDAFCSSDLDAVVVVTPPPTHLECTLKALEAGKHVLCEVPAVVTLEEAAALADKVRRTGLKYMIAENVCYFPCIQKMQQLVDEGAIGRIILAEGEYVHDARTLLYNRDDGLGGGSATVPSWREAFNPIQYLTHELGPLLMILRDRVVTAVCLESSAAEGPVQTQTALFQTAEGRTIRELTAFKIAREPAHHFYALYGSKGSVETDRYRWYENLKFYSETRADQKSLADIPISHVHPDAPPEAHSGGHGTSEYYMVNDFIRSILDDRRPPLDVQKALDMTVPGICAVLSARQNGQIVRIPEFDANLL
jgi:predicted dehydrogenase